MTIFKRPLHRKIERAFKCKKDSLQKAVSDLKTKYQFDDYDIVEKAKECAQYCIDNKADFVIAFNLYVSCLNNPKV
jgi:chromosome segregation and condensation protein ScpB